MPQLFGLDIAGIVSDAIGSAGDVRPGSFVRTAQGTRGAGDSVLDGASGATTTHSFKGFTETTTVRIDGTDTPMAKVSILGASVTPAAVPKVGDVVTFSDSDSSESWTLTELVGRDPAAALFEFMAEASTQEEA